jgi:4-hydroxy 2-oxovalerate aldolase
MVHVKDEHAKGSWLGYRPDIKILDCTVRDGGLINDHLFDDGFVKTVYETCVAAGVDYMEIGYKASKRIFAPDKHGRWKYCDEDAIRRIVGDAPSNLKLAVMADAERCDYRTDILPKKDSAVDLVRVAAYINQIPLAVDMINDAHQKGYETVMQLMSISVVGEHELNQALQTLVRTPVTAIYVVDSFGALYSEQVRDLTLTVVEALKGTGKEVGIHAHNNQQLAYANTIEALIMGASRLDATINGMGRGAGNCPLELLLGFLHNPKFRVRPVLRCIQDVFLPLRQKLDWGYSIPYMITGQLNQHPRAAIACRSGDAPDDYVAFYDSLVEEE